MQIYVRQINGNGYKLEVNPILPISQIWQQLKNVFAEIPENYEISWKNYRNLSMTQTFQSLGIMPQSILHIAKCDQQREMEKLINVRIFYQNQIYAIRISNQDKLLKLKQIVHRMVRVPPKQQFLYFRGKKLGDSNTLTEESIINDSLISLTIQKKFDQAIGSNEFVRGEQTDLLDSVTSLQPVLKVSEKSNTTLFRSDSIGSKKTQNTIPAEVKVKISKDYFDLGASVESQIETTAQIATFTQRKYSNNYIGGSLKLDELKEEPEFIMGNQEQKSSQNEESLYNKLDFEENSSLFNSLNFEDKLKPLVGITSKSILRPIQLNPEFLVNSPMTPNSPGQHNIEAKTFQNFKDFIL